MRHIFAKFVGWCLLIGGGLFDGLLTIVQQFLQSNSIGFATFIGVGLYIWIKDNLQDLAWATKVLWHTYLAR